MKLPSIKTLRNKCDALLTPIIKKMFPKCMLCGADTQVAHHHVHKSQSTRLRYEIDNLIPLCNSCHLALHMNESYHASRIVEKRGLDWWKRLDKMKHEIVKADRFFYQQNYERLKEMLGGDN